MSHKRHTLATEDEELESATPPRKLKTLQWKCVLIMADSVWDGQSAYCGLEVKLSDDGNTYALTSNWICPVSECNGPIATKDNIAVGYIVKIPVVKHAEHRNQPENWIVNRDTKWEVVKCHKLHDCKGGKDQYSVISKMMRDPNIAQNTNLWYDDTSRLHIPNERISVEKLHEVRTQPGYQSCRLIHVESLQVTLFHRTYGKLVNGNDKYKNFRRGKFQYSGLSYELKITEREDTLLEKMGEENLLTQHMDRSFSIFPHEREKIQKEILSCYLLVALLAGDRSFAPNDDPSTQYYYKIITHIYTKGAEAEVRDLNQLENENLPTCEELLHASFTVPDAIDDWEKGFLQSNRLKDYWDLTDRQQRKFVQIHDKIGQNCHLN